MLPPINVRRNLNLSDEQRSKHLISFQKLSKNDSYLEIFNFLYDNLNILDSKSSALLTFNSIIIAVLAVWTDDYDFATIDEWQILFYILYFVFFILLLISSLLSLISVYIFWSSTEDFNSPDENLKKLLKLREDRTIQYRRSWWLAFMGITGTFLTRFLEFVLTTFVI